MTEALTVPAAQGIEARHDLDRAVRTAAALAQETLAPATRRAYASDWAAFETWCSRAGLTPLPAAPEAVVAYLGQLVEEGLSYSTIERALTGIAHVQHQQDPLWQRNHHLIAKVMRGIRTTLGTATEKKTAIDDECLLEIVSRRPKTLLGTLERAVLLLGWSSALRRSNIAALDITDVKFVKQGLVITVRRSKTDQVGAGRVLGIELAKNEALCASRALDNWLTVSGRRKAGPLFRVVDARTGKLTERRLRPDNVADIVKRAVRDVGLTSDQFAGHSLRRGFATTAAAAGVPLDAIKRQTGHKSLTVLTEDYIIPATVFADNATKGLI